MRNQLRVDLHVSWHCQLPAVFRGVGHVPSGCEGDGDVASVVTPLVRGGAQVLHGDQVVELSVLLEVHEKEEEGEDGEGQIEVEGEDVEIKERRAWMTVRII